MSEEKEPQPRISGQFLKQKARAEIQAMVERSTETSRAQAIIYSALTKWTGVHCAHQLPIPIVRNGEKIDELPPCKILSLDGPVHTVIKQAERMSSSELKSEVDRYRQLAEQIEAVLEVCADFTELEFTRLTLNIFPLKNYPSEETERVIQAINPSVAQRISAQIILDGALKHIAELEAEIESIAARKLGRPKNQSAHGVAWELAKLYSKVTGLRPTYSEGRDGVSGPFTPVLRDVFDALGWEAVSLKTPIENAISRIEDSHLEHQVKSDPRVKGLLSGGFL